MGNLKTLIRVTIALGTLSLLAVLITLLAMTDIYHGEADVALEWSIVRVCALVLLVFIGMVLFTLGRALRTLT